MLSRVAERVYWAARYLERASSTAQLVSSYENLLYDLPVDYKMSWYNLIIINDLEEAFNERYSNRTERNVIKFLLADEDNQSSLLNSLKAVKENVRTTRDVVPEEAWELICELSLFARENLEQGLKRRSRHEFLDEIMKGCLQITGLLGANMPRDAAWDFLQLGLNIERADMTTRYLEAGLTAILALEDDQKMVNSEQIIWGSVLRSLGATQYYLRTTRTPVKGHEVLPYLLQDPHFPKSITHCLQSIINACEELPRSEQAVSKLKTVERKLTTEVDYEDPGDAVLEHLNQLQILLTGSHFIISEAWFPAEV